MTFLPDQLIFSREKMTESGKIFEDSGKILTLSGKKINLSGNMKTLSGRKIKHSGTWVAFGVNLITFQRSDYLYPMKNKTNILVMTFLLCTSWRKLVQRQILLISFLLLAAWTSFAGDKNQHKFYNISYRDSDKTYLQVAIYDSVEGKIVAKPGKVELFQGNEKKAQCSVEIKVENQNKPVECKLKEGDYSVSVDNSEIDTIHIREHKLNMLHLYIKNGVLQFSYSQSKAAPTEYDALVKEQFGEKKTVTQHCGDAVKYKTGLYSIEVNSIPPYKANVAIMYNSTYEIALPKPGKLIIKGVDKSLNIQIYQSVKNAWTLIEHIDFTLAKKDPIKLLSKPYKITWVKKGQLKTGYFVIRPDKTTSIECD